MASKCRKTKREATENAGGRAGTHSSAKLRCESCARRGRKRVCAKSACAYLRRLALALLLNADACSTGLLHSSMTLPAALDVLFLVEALPGRQVDRLRRVVRRPTDTALMWMSAGRLSLPESQAAQVSDIVTRCSSEGGRMRWKDAEERERG